MSRPRLSLPTSLPEQFLDGIAFIILIVSISIVFSVWGLIPDRVPRHFGLSGPPDAWGGKGNLLIFPVMNLIFFIGFAVLCRFPHLFNYPWEITEENAPRQYRLARTLIRWLRLVVMAFFTYLEWLMIRITQGNSVGLGKWLAPMMAGVIIVSLGIYIVKSRQAR